MARIYEDGRLKRIDCDGCDATIIPHVNISESGWMKSGVTCGPGHPNNIRLDHCPRCWSASRLSK